MHYLPILTGAPRATTERWAMAKHTPGPWAVSRRGFKQKPSIVGKPHVSVAVFDSGDREADEANACLAAAAPEMLAALKQAERALVAVYGEPPLLSSPGDAEMWPALHQAGRDIETIRTAIAKAEAA